MSCGKLHPSGTLTDLIKPEVEFKIIKLTLSGGSYENISFIICEIKKDSDLLTKSTAQEMRFHIMYLALHIVRQQVINVSTKEITSIALFNVLNLDKRRISPWTLLLFEPQISKSTEWKRL